MPYFFYCAKYLEILFLTIEQFELDAFCLSYDLSWILYPTTGLF